MNEKCSNASYSVVKHNSVFLLDRKVADYGERTQARISKRQAATGEIVSEGQINIISSDCNPKSCAVTSTIDFVLYYFIDQSLLLEKARLCL